MSGEARTNERGPALGQNNRGKRERELKAPLE